MRTIQLQGDTVAYSHHDVSGTPLLLVHGVGSSAQTWGDLPERFARAGHSVIAVDLLGHGESGFGNGDYSLGAQASRIRDLLDHLGIGRVHLVGHSLGGGVCMQFQYQFPERVDSTTLISSGGLGDEVSVALRAATLPGAELVMRSVLSEPTVNALEGLSRSLVAKGRRGLDERSLTKLRRLQQPARLRAFLSTVRSVVGPDGQRVSGVDKLRAIARPGRVLIIWGDRDRTVPIEHGRTAHEQLKGSRMVVVPAGHRPHVDAPDEVFAAVLDFVNEVNHDQRVSA